MRNGSIVAQLAEIEEREMGHVDGGISRLICVKTIDCWCYCWRAVKSILT